VAEDHPIFLDAVERLLSLEPDFEVVARCRDGNEVLRAIAEHAPDLLVLDIRMPRKDGLAVLRELRHSGRETPTVVLTAGLTDLEVAEVLRLGVRGFVLKEMAPQALVQCVRAVREGRHWLERGTVARASDALLRVDASQEKATRLTPRELDVVRKVAAGLPNKAVAHELKMSEGTIKTHLHNIYEKLGVNGRFALIHWAKRRGLT
jgi:two-component system NarL family response regulator/two-component system nitrate/nitrite response regulator NarL